jgi:hypothetical protein
VLKPVQFSKLPVLQLQVASRLTEAGVKGRSITLKIKRRKEGAHGVALPSTAEAVAACSNYTILTQAAGCKRILIPSSYCLVCKLQAMASVTAFQGH